MPEAWFHDRTALRLIVLRYLPWLAVLNLAWEAAQLPLYTIWRDASVGYIAFAVAHCTAGDVLIGAGALAISLVPMRAGRLNTWPWLGIVASTATLGAIYTIGSEWMNTSLRLSWEYSPSMPVVNLHGAAIGLSPVAQWLVLPPLALLLARRSNSEM